MSSGRQRKHQQGFTYLLALFAVALVGLLLAAASEIWSQSHQREKEQELLFAGNQFRDAIALYYQRTPGAAKRYPEKLEDLLEDKRYLSMQRYLRKIYTDPMTGKPQWGTVAAPEGGIMGVYSLSSATPVKTGNFRAADQAFEGSSQISDWRFVYMPTQSGTAAPAATPQAR
jgi:type II secretory pathway pseudopilin PulG